MREIGSEIRWGAVVAGKGMLAPELSYRGAYGVDGDKGPANGELLAGLRRAGPVEVFGLGGPGFFNRVGTPQWRALAGLAFRFDRTPPPPVRSVRAGADAHAGAVPGPRRRQRRRPQQGRRVPDGGRHRRAEGLPGEGHRR